MPKNRKTYAQKVAYDKRSSTKMSSNIEANQTSQTFSFSFLPKTKPTSHTQTETYAYVKTDLLKTISLTGVLILCEAIVWFVMNLKK